MLAQRVLGHQQPKTVTFSKALLEYGEHCYPRLRPRTVKDYKRVFASHFSRKLGDYRLTEITFDIVTAITDKLVSTPTEHKHALIVSNTFFRWCIRRRYITHSPIAGVDVPKPPPRKRALSDEELVKVYRAAEAMGAPFGTVVQLLILTGQRRGEIGALRPAWFKHNEQALVFPPEITKNKREHILPLAPLALQVLATTTPAYGFYFPSKPSDPKAYSAFSKPKKRLDAMLEGVVPFTLHDLRRTFSTNIAKLGVPPHIKEALLNHASAKTEVEAIYDLYQYLPEMRQALEQWEKHLTALLTVEAQLPLAA